MQALSSLTHLDMTNHGLNVHHKHSSYWSRDAVVHRLLPMNVPYHLHGTLHNLSYLPEQSASPSANCDVKLAEMSAFVHLHAQH